MSRFKTGDLVRYIRGREGAATISLRQAKDIEWRHRRVGLIQCEADPSTDPAAKAGNWTASVMYYVLWNDMDDPQLIPEWNLELVPEDGS